MKVNIVNWNSGLRPFPPPAVRPVANGLGDFIRTILRGTMVATSVNAEPGRPSALEFGVVQPTAWTIRLVAKNRADLRKYAFLLNPVVCDRRVRLTVNAGL